jgi:hypothetical protein
MEKERYIGKFRIDEKLYETFAGAMAVLGDRSVEDIKIQDKTVYGGWRGLAACEINDDEDSRD